MLVKNLYAFPIGPDRQLVMTSSLKERGAVDVYSSLSPIKNRQKNLVE